MKANCILGKLQVSSHRTEDFCKTFALTGIHHIHAGGLEFAGVCYTDTDCNQNEECYYSDEAVAYECRCKRGYIRGQDGLCVAIQSK